MLYQLIIKYRKKIDTTRGKLHNIFYSFLKQKIILDPEED